jgi:hypothetical protein
MDAAESYHAAEAVDAGHGEGRARTPRHWTMRNDEGSTPHLPGMQIFFLRRGRPFAYYTARACRGCSGMSETDTPPRKAYGRSPLHRLSKQIYVQRRAEGATAFRASRSDAMTGTWDVIAARCFRVDPPPRSREKAVRNCPKRRGSGEKRTESEQRENVKSDEKRRPGCLNPNKHQREISFTTNGGPGSQRNQRP